MGIQGDTKRPSMGLARVLSKQGFCSRSAARELVRDGKVAVNTVIVKDPDQPVRRGKDSVSVNGQVITRAKKVYLMINKPRGIVTTASDERGRATIYSLLPENRQWLAPVGRLDKASEGLLLLTNDSEWGARVAAPETHLDKTYHVQISCVPDDSLLRSLRSGIRDKKGELLRSKRVTLVRRGARHCWVEIVLEEGKNRQIRRMLAALGIEVLRLVRIAIGPLQLGDLAKGAVRELTREEKRRIDEACRTSRQTMTRNSRLNHR